MGPFKCYVMQWGVGGCQLSRKKRYEGARFNVISVTRGWVGVKYPGKKHCVTIERPLCYDYVATDQGRKKSCTMVDQTMVVLLSNWDTPICGTNTHKKLENQ